MTQFLRGIGALIFFGTIAVVGLMSAQQNNLPIAVALAALPPMTAGAVLFGLGQMIEHLGAIRVATERQADLLAKFAERRPATP